MADKSRNTEYRRILKVTRFATVLNHLVNGQTFSLKGENFAMSTQERPGDQQGNQCLNETLPADLVNNPLLNLCFEIHSDSSVWNK